MRLFSARAFCSICNKLIIGEECSELDETEGFMQNYHFTEFKHFVDGEPKIVEVKSEKPIFPARTPKPDGTIKPLKKKKADRYG